MRWLFDMDGTIVDTHRALRMCYRKAGITMPEDAFGKRWQEWCPEDIHREKIRLYPNFLREYVRILPAADLLRLTRGAVLTGASHQAVNAVQFIIGDFDVEGQNCTEDEKIAIMIAHHYPKLTGEPLMWVDDRKDFGMRALEEVGAHFLHVTEFDGVFNLYSPGAPGRVQRWTLSSWQLAATSG